MRGGSYSCCLGKVSLNPEYSRTAPSLRPSPPSFHLLGILDEFMAPPPHFPPCVSGMIGEGLPWGRGEPPAQPRVHLPQAGVE